MRILAVRGSNIASLSGSFEVDFERPPLSGAGLFAITGPTGAGKSTLLDVLCLALFGETPRVSEAGLVKVPVTGTADAAAQTLTAKDARNLLRRGASEGHAEVEFVGSDGRRYRAVWRVRRAHGRATGNLREASRALFRRDGDGETPIADGKTETDEKVPEVLGLSFDQFRKAVLLAQGDFAAFLRAKEKDRAELLEKITGGEIYSAISEKAWKRGQAVLDALAGAKRALDSLVLLDEEGRRSRQAGSDGLTAELRALDARRDRLAEARHRAEEASRREKEGADAAAGVTGATGRLEEKAESVRSARDAAAEAAEALRAARGRQESRKPELDRAKALDAKLDSKRESARLSEGEAVAARAARDAAAKEAARLGSELASAAAEGEAARKWLEAHPADREVAAAWEACSSDLDLLVDRRKEAAIARATLEGAARASREARARLDEAAAAMLTAVGVLGEADAEAARTAEAVATVDRAALATESRLASAEAGALKDLGHLADGIARACSAREAGDAGERDAIEREQRAVEAGERAHLDVEAAEAEAAALDRERTRALAAESLEERRAALVPGEECPLCGSKEHPWASAGAGPGRPAAEIEGRLKAAATVLTQARGRETGARHDAASARNDAAKAAAERRKADEDLASLRQRWMTAAASLPGPDRALDRPPEAATVFAARAEISARLEAALGRKEDVDRREREAVGLDRAAADARERREKARQERDGAAETHHAAEKARLEAEKEEGTARQAAEALEREVRGLAGRLERFTGDDPEAARLLGEEPARLAAAWAARVDELRRRERTLDDALGRASRLAPEESGARERLAGAGRSVTEKEEASRGAAREVAALEDERRGLLDGRGVAETESALAAAVASAEKELAEADRGAGEAVAAFESAKGALDAATRHAAESAVRAAGARAARDEALAGAGLPPAADDAVEAVAKALEALRLEREEREGRLRTLVAELAADDGKREEARTLEAEIEKTGHDGKVWLALRELIGEAGGGKFRKFAQGLTLEALVRAANHHLDDFARRYRLVQAPGTEVGLLVVDRDMGDEMRSVESLSGGESFLVSLALALGLASLAGKRATIGSLFIDEGFGSLDADTLDRAVAALDAVRAQHDRRIGVISHVQGLAEKIGVQVKVVAKGGGRSEVKVVSA